MVDHDQRFKIILKVFLREFFQLFFIDWYDRFDFSLVEWLEQELHLDPPQGSKGSIDLLARIGIRAFDPPLPNHPRQQIVLIHVEVESRDSVEQFRQRMYEYYKTLCEKYPDLDILPIAIYMRVGLEGRGIDVYERRFWERTPLRFEYDYVGLPALPSEEYLHGTNVLGIAWSALMRAAKERRAQLAAEAIDRIVASEETEWRKWLLVECVQAYAPLDDSQRLELVDLLKEPQREGVTKMVLTWSEEAALKAIQRAVLLMIQEKFHVSPTDELKQRVKSLSDEQLDQVFLDLVGPKTLKEMGLED